MKCICSVIGLVWFLLSCMSQSVLAVQVANRSAEMLENSLCDQAGIIKMTLDQTDWSDIGDWLATQTMH